jgi:hypothetical protein
MILQGTMQDGTVIPVQVDAQGRLVAEGLPGPAGPQGPAGPAGPVGPDGGLTLPPGAQRGDVLYWNGSELAWHSGLIAPPLRLTADLGQADSSLFDGTFTRTYWRSALRIWGVKVPLGAKFGYRGAIEQGNPAPTHTVFVNGVQVAVFQGTVGDGNWLLSSNYSLNQGTVSKAISAFDEVVITSNDAGWIGIDQIIVDGVPVVTTTTLRRLW